MSNMFTNYDLTPENYIPNNVIYDKIVPNTPKYPLVAYNVKDEAIGYTWNYGDSIYLEFTTTGNVVYDDAPNDFTEDASTYLEGKKFQLLIYNFRYDVVAQAECPAAPVVRILSDSFCPYSLVKGVYHLKFTLVDENNNVLATLIDGNDGIIFIK